jgi:hypothetical protein
MLQTIFWVCVARASQVSHLTIDEISFANGGMVKSSEQSRDFDAVPGISERSESGRSTRRSLRVAQRLNYEMAAKSVSSSRFSFST